MEIIFSNLPKYLDFLALSFRKLGITVWYLELSGGIINTANPDPARAEYLKGNGVLPLPLADLPGFREFSDVNYDPSMTVLKHTEGLVPAELLKSLQDLFPGIADAPKKLQILVHSMIAPQYMTVTGKVNIWARRHTNTRYLLIDVSSNGFLNVGLEPAVRQIVLPWDIVKNGLIMILGRIISLFSGPAPAGNSPPAQGKPSSPQSPDSPPATVAFVVHKGLDYGNLFRKELFYSAEPGSALHPERLLHIDYSGWPAPPGTIQWVRMGDHRRSALSNISAAFIALSRGIIQIRSSEQVLGLIILARSYIIFRSFLEQIKKYPEIRVALIDYDFLCPKELILAFESRKITTIATQERFIATFGNLFSSIILDQYLCDSGFAAGVMKRSPIKCISQYVPVGQYRSDILLKGKNAPPPAVLEGPVSRNQKIITALGFHTPLEWHNSQLDPILNWNAHRHFLADMIRLSQDISGSFIILRYKDLDWISLPVFTDLMQEIRSKDNIVISTDYDKAFVSYDLCAHSDLVIAKHTSLADECLSVGIPVLFHEYTHNSERLVADAFDYAPARILCFNYSELKERVEWILSGSPHPLTPDYDYLKQEVFGDLGDGSVVQRIHTHIEKKCRIQRARNDNELT